MESNLELPWFALLRNVIGAEKLASLSGPIRFKTEINCHLVTRVFPRFKPFALVYFKLSLAAQYVFPSSDWLM